MTADEPDKTYASLRVENAVRIVERIIAAREAAAEQRGREDNEDHAQCYVSGSRALEALIERAEQRGREAVLADVEALAATTILGDLCGSEVQIPLVWAADLTALIAKHRRADHHDGSDR